MDFLDEDGLKRDAAGRYSVLYLPHCYALDDAAVAGLRRGYVGERGDPLGRWTDRWKDEAGNVRPQMPGAGRRVRRPGRRIQPMPGPFTALAARDARAAKRSACGLRFDGAEAIEKDADGLPVATRHRFGKGTAIFYGTALTLGYHQQQEPKAQPSGSPPRGRGACEMAVSASTTAPRVFFRGLKCPEGLAPLLTIRADAACEWRSAATSPRS